jgi:hypothetical protein
MADQTPNRADEACVSVIPCVEAEWTGHQTLRPKRIDDPGP